MEDVIVQLMDLPTTIRSFVVVNSDASYTVMLNSRLSHERLILAYQHELLHIKNGDYDKQCDVNKIEVFAHN